MTKPIVRVFAFKKNGTFYSSHESELVAEHYESSKDSSLMGLFQGNHPSVHQYSPVGDFGKEFYYMVHVEYPSNIKGFCTVLINREKAS
jgi:hypothetical protein